MGFAKGGDRKLSREYVLEKVKSLPDEALKEEADTSLKVWRYKV